MPRIKHAAILTLRSLTGHTWSLLYYYPFDALDVLMGCTSYREGVVAADGAADLADLEDLLDDLLLRSLPAPEIAAADGAADLADLEDLLLRALASLDTLGFSALMLLSAATH